jgi:hypothetical protein
MKNDDRKSILGCEILRTIGRGAYGEVFLARDLTGLYRAVKVISRESFDDDRPYEREFEGLQKFEAISRSDESQVQILQVGRREEPKQFFYIMELADDQDTGRNINPDNYTPKTLRSELKRQGRLPASTSITIGLALTRALARLHGAGLIHRDIKPANIIFVENQPKLADIGLVTNANISVSHVGTDGFIPPEGPTSVQSDIYSLGKVLYECCTGRDRMNFPELPTNLYEIADRTELMELNAVITKACAREPSSRYESASEMAKDLGYIQRGGSVRRRRATRRRLVFLSQLVAVIGALTLIAVAVYCFQTGAMRAAAATSLMQPGTGLRAKYLVVAADDFVIDIYQNGKKVEDSKRHVLAERYGAMVERVNIEVQKGDWLVFNVVNNRFRWHGACYFAVAGILSNDKFGFVTESKSGTWSACDSPVDVPRFILEKNYLTNSPAILVQREWQGGLRQMKDFTGQEWSGEAIWGKSRNTWIKIGVR